MNAYLSNELVFQELGVNDDRACIWSVSRNVSHSAKFISYQETVTSAKSAWYKALSYYTLSYLTLTTILGNWDFHQFFLKLRTQAQTGQVLTAPRICDLTQGLSSRATARVHVAIAPTGKPGQRNDLTEGDFPHCHNSSTHLEVNFLFPAAICRNFPGGSKGLE